MDIKKYLIIAGFFALIGGYFSFSYDFSLRLVELLLAGVAASWLLIALSEKFVQAKPIILFATAAIAYAIAYQLAATPLLLAAFLIGTSLFLLYWNLEERMYTVIPQLMSAVIVLYLLLTSAIVKFRGFNKISETDIALTIPIILLAYAGAYLINRILRSIIKKPHRNTNALFFFISAICIAGIFLAISALFYKEIGIATLFVPLAAGLAAGAIDTVFPKRNAAKDIAQLFFTFITPYAIAGFLGVGCSLVAGFLWTILFSPLFRKEERQPTFYDLVLPILFLIGLVEFRENAGLITRFSLTVGYQVGWLFIGVIATEYALRGRDFLKQILKENALEHLISYASIVFTILVATVIIQVGKDAALAGLIYGGSISLFINGLFQTPHSEKDVSTIASLVACIGALAFFVLIRF